MAIDTFISFVGVYASVDDAIDDYEAVKLLHTELGLIDAYDAAVIEHKANGKVKIVKKHETPTRVGGVLGGGIGLATGLAVSFLIEAVTMAAQAVSTQAGFAFASTVDPNTEADSTVLILIAQLTAAMLFFALGLDRQLLSILARSLETHPPGAITSSRASAEALVMLGSGIFTTGLRLALPLMALLFLIDLSVGLLGRLSSQLQLIALAFPAKMLAAVAALSVLVLLIPQVFQQSASVVFGVLRKFLGL